MGNNKETYVANVLEMMKAHFGNAVKSYWVYDDDLCPGCMTHPIDVMIYEGKKTVSLNGFMYRAKGVLIGYPLCEQCAKEVMANAKKEPKNDKTSRHLSIEKNLIDAYHRYLASLAA